MLTIILLALPVWLTHWLMRELGVYEGVHNFLAGLCPCSVAA